MVNGNQAHAQGLREEVAGILAPMGLRLSEAKTKVCHVDEGFDFLGFHIQRRRKKGTGKYVVYTYPSKKALASIVGRVRVLTNRSSHPALAVLLRQLNPVLQGWCTYFRYGGVQSDLRLSRPVHLAPGRPLAAQTTSPHEDGRPQTPLPTRFPAHRGRGDVVPAAAGDGQPLPLPGGQHPHTLGQSNTRTSRTAQRHGLVESPVLGDGHAGFGGRAEET
jgi:hypothetical protein